jgi:tryptophan halogenase
MIKDVNKIAVVGAGTSGYLSILMLCNEFPDTEVFWYKPLDNKPIGVGEALVPAVSNWLARYGITHEDMLRHCDGTIKLGVKFEDWYTEGEEFLFPAGKGTEKLREGFDSSYRKEETREDLFGDDVATRVVCTAATIRKMMGTGLVFPNLLDYYTVSTHIDVIKFIQYLEDTVLPNFSNLNILAETVESYESIEGMYDILIDSTGFKRVLAKDKGDFRPLDSPGNSAYTYRAPYTNKAEQLQPFTRVIARPKGWVWNIPLKYERTYGYIHDRDIGTKEDFIEYLRSEVGEIDESNIGQVFWKVGIEENPLITEKLFTTGLAAGFLEPLQATGLYMMTRTLNGIHLHLRGKMSLTEANEYINSEVLSIYEFIKAHYKYSGRPEEYWNSFNDLEVEEYKSTGGYPDTTNWSYLLKGVHRDFKKNTLDVNYLELAKLHREGVPYEEFISQYL